MNVLVHVNVNVPDGLASLFRVRPRARLRSRSREPLKARSDPSHLLGPLSKLRLLPSAHFLMPLTGLREYTRTNVDMESSL